MTQVDDLSRSLAAFDQNTSLVAVVEMSEASWLVAGLVPGLDRQPLKKLEPDPNALLRLLERWQAEAVKAGQTIGRVTLAYEAGRDGFWLARWLQAHGIEIYVIHSTSVAVSREHRRAKTDRLDTAMLMRVFLGWLRGEKGHCGMVAIPTLEEEDAKRPSRERESLVGEQTRIANRMKSALARLGIRGFKPKLRRAPQRLAALRTPEDLPIPPNRGSGSNRTESAFQRPNGHGLLARDKCMSLCALNPLKSQAFGKPSAIRIIRWFSALPKRSNALLWCGTLKRTFGSVATGPPILGLPHFAWIVTETDR